MMMNINKNNYNNNKYGHLCFANNKSTSLTFCENNTPTLYAFFTVIEMAPRIILLAILTFSTVVFASNENKRDGKVYFRVRHRGSKKKTINIFPDPDPLVYKICMT